MKTAALHRRVRALPWVLAPSTMSAEAGDVTGTQRPGWVAFSDESGWSNMEWKGTGTERLSLLLPVAFAWKRVSDQAERLESHDYSSSAVQNKVVQSVVCLVYFLEMY